MNSKKAITLLVLATLLLSFVPIMPVQAAVSNQIVEDVTGGVPSGQVADGSVYVYGDTLAVTGDGVAPGQDIELWWDGITKLNTTDGDADGSFELWFDIPEAIAGPHYVWVKVPSTGDFVKAVTLNAAPAGAVMVGPSIELDPGSGLVGEEVTIKGYGYGDEVDITFVNFTAVPVTTSPSTPETSSLGSWTATFVVPSYPYATYPVDATDATNIAATTFEIGASISLDVDEGPSGTVVEISGRGFSEGAGISNGTITYGGLPCYIVTDNVKVRPNADNTFVVDVVIPDTPGVEGDQLLVVTESGAGPDESASADFDLLGHPGIEMSPEYGPAGSTIVVSGFNFTQIAGEEVTLMLGGIGAGTVVETDANGEFEGAFRIPGASGTPPLTATQTAYGLAASELFRVGFITVVVDPQSGPAGSWIGVTGSGFDPIRDWNATINGEEWIPDTAVGAGGVIGGTTHVPSLEAGIYEILISESVTGIQVSAEFEVTAPTTVETSPVVAPAEYDVTIMGYNFAENPINPTEAAITCVLWNDTASWPLDVEYNSVPVALQADGDWDNGYWEGDFTLPDEDELEVGTYYINVTDGVGMFYQLMFEVVDKTVDIEPKMPVFQIGDTCGFDVESSFPQPGSYIQIYDPEGNLYWETDPFFAGLWIQVGTIERVPYYSQVAGGNPMTFLEDAPLGEWTWTWYMGDDELDSGVFGLEPSDDSVLSDQVTDLSESISDLSGQVSDVTDEFADIKSDIADVASTAADAVAAAEAASDAVAAVAQTANTASEAASDAAEAANAAKDAANGLTTLVYGAIGAALVAALAAIVSLMQISRRIAG